jgi:deoxyribodipyrimidine photolyase-like uncharacterized protein
MTRTPLNGVEGFVRQVLGRREWIWHLYWYRAYAHHIQRRRDRFSSLRGS